MTERMLAAILVLANLSATALLVVCMIDVKRRYDRVIDEWRKINEAYKKLEQARRQQPEDDGEWWKK